MRLPPRNDLRWALVVFSTGFLLLIWVWLALHLVSERAYTLESRRAENDNLARFFEEHVQRTVAAASITLKHIEMEYRQHGDMLDLAQYYEDRQDEFEPYTSLGVVDEHGDLVLTNLPFTEPLNLRSVENFQFHSRDASEDIFISKPRFGTLTQRSTIFLSRRINNADGSFGGYTVISMDALYFSRLYNQTGSGVEVTITLIRRDGIVLAERSNNTSVESVAGQNIIDSALFREYLPQSEQGTYDAVGPIDGIDRLYSYRSVRTYPLVVLVGVASATALQRFETRKNIYLRSAGAISLVILIFTGLMMSQISHEIRMTDEIRKREERYALIERGTNDGIWDWDLNSGASYFSPRWKEIHGNQNDETQIHSEAFLESIHPEDRKKYEQIMAQRTPEEKKPYRIEYRFQKNNGELHWLLSRGKVVRDKVGQPSRIVGTVTDITERKNLELYLESQSRLLDLIFTHTLESIALLDKDYNFIKVSDSYAKATQREVSEFEGRNHFDLFPSNFEQELEPYRQEKRIYSRAERPFVFPDHPELGTTYWDLGLVPFLDEDREIELFLFTLRDVTRRVRADEKVRDYAQRMSALSDHIITVQEEDRRALARELHDEVGQNLTAVKIHLQALLAKYQDDDMVFLKDTLRIALDTTAIVLEQVRDISMNLRPMQLDELGLVVALGSLLERSANLSGWISHFDENLPKTPLNSNLEIACYRVAQEALTNIMRHADATEVWLTLHQTNQALILTVRDNGRGFDPTIRVQPGTSGLGLLGIEERVKNLKGHLDIRSKCGEGTLLQVIFPISEIYPDRGELA